MDGQWKRRGILPIIRPSSNQLTKIRKRWEHYKTVRSRTKHPLLFQTPSSGQRGTSSTRASGNHCHSRSGWAGWCNHPAGSTWARGRGWTQSFRDVFAFLERRLVHLYKTTATTTTFAVLKAHRIRHKNQLLLVHRDGTTVIRIRTHNDKNEWQEQNKGITRAGIKYSWREIPSRRWLPPRPWKRR